MIDPFDAALSEFIDTLPPDPELARQLLAENAPFTGRGDLPEFAELATMLRGVPPYQPGAEWMAASKARLMAAPLLPPERRGFTWLGTMFLPFTQLSFPTISLPRLSMPSPAFARAAMAFVVIAAVASVAHKNAGQNPILQVTADQAPVQDAQQAIAATQEQVARLADTQQGQVAGVEIQGTPRDVVLLSQQIDLAELAIDKAPPAEQPRLRSELQSAVRAVRFDGRLEAVTNDTTLQVSGVAVQADPALVQQLHVGQPVSLLVRVNSNGKLQAVQAVPAPPPPSSPPAPASSQPPGSSPPGSPPPSSSGGTAPLTSSSNTSAVADDPPAAASPSPAASVAPVSPTPATPPGNHKDVKHGDDQNGRWRDNSLATPPGVSSGNGPAPWWAAAQSAQPSNPGGPAAPPAPPAPVTGGVTPPPPPLVQSMAAPSNTGATSAVAGASTSSSQISSSVTTGSSQVTTSVTNTSSTSSSSSSHSVTVTVSSSSTSSGQQSSSGGSQSSVHGNSAQAQVSRTLQAVRLAVSYSEDKGKGKGGKKG